MACARHAWEDYLAERRRMIYDRTANRQEFLAWTDSLSLQTPEAPLAARTVAGSRASSLEPWGYAWIASEQTLAGSLP